MNSDCQMDLEKSGISREAALAIAHDERIVGWMSKWAAKQYETPVSEIDIGIGRAVWTASPEICGHRSIRRLLRAGLGWMLRQPELRPLIMRHVLTNGKTTNEKGENEH